MLSLERIAGLLRQRSYGAAFFLASEMRVDLNFIVDFLGSDFLTSAAALVDGVDDAAAICDLVTALKAGDCTAPGGSYAVDMAVLQEARARGTTSDTVHSSIQQPGQGVELDKATVQQFHVFQDKVAQCCAALRDACAARGGRFLQAVIMSHLRCAWPLACSQLAVQQAQVLMQKFLCV